MRMKPKRLARKGNGGPAAVEEDEKTLNPEANEDITEAQQLCLGRG